MATHKCHCLSNLTVCIHGPTVPVCQPLLVRESCKVSFLPFPVFLLACLCVPLMILSDTNRRNFNDPVDPGVQSTIESAQTHSPRPYAQTWSLGVWTGATLVRSMFLSGPEELLWRPAPSRPEPRKSQGHWVFIPSPLPPLLQMRLCEPCGGGAVSLLYLSVSFLVSALIYCICLCVSCCLSENSTWS